MRIDIITVLPEMLEGFFNESILARAQKKGLAEIHLHNLRDYTLDKWKRVDDYPYGGSAGMVMQCEPIDRCITALKAEREYDDVIYVSPDGETFNQKIANEMSLGGNLIILCGHYKGIDQRVRDHVRFYIRPAPSAALHTGSGILRLWQCCPDSPQALHKYGKQPRSRSSFPL